MNSKAIYLIFSLIFFPFVVRAANVCGTKAQGEIMLGHAPGYKEVIFKNQPHRIAEDGTFLIAFTRDEVSPVRLTLVQNDNKKITYKFGVKPTKWDIQNLKGVPPRKVTPSAADQKAIDHERKLVRGGLTGNTASVDWQQGFIWPVKGRISGNFGGQRIMNGKKMNPHGGTDIAAPVGTPVLAPAPGTVTLTADDTFYSGNVIILDHGFGLQTIYAHLNKINVKEGQKVKQGEIIGLVGKTGRVTGPHLHWGASLRGTRFNALSLLHLKLDNNLCFNL